MIVRFADWEFCCLLPMFGSEAGGGLQIVFAVFQGRPVLERASQPFVLVNYHDTEGPFFKDGLKPAGFGVPFEPLKPDAPNAGDWDVPEDAKANNEAEAIVVEREPATSVSPASVAVWAKFQAGNYQYIQRWEFRADGIIEPGVGLGGPLFGSQPWIIQEDPERSERLRALSHIHNFYFRLDFQIGRGGNQVIERQDHGTDPLFWAGFDNWETVTRESRDTSYSGSNYNRWRIRHRFQTNSHGQPISYEVAPGTPDQPDGVFSRGDFFVHRRAGFSEQLGHDVGSDDTHLTNGYGMPGLSWIDELLGRGRLLGDHDVIIWHVLREHHRTASLGEERLTLPYHFHHFTIRPRDFLDETPRELYTTEPASPLNP